MQVETLCEDRINAIIEDCLRLKPGMSVNLDETVRQTDAESLCRRIMAKHRGRTRDEAMDILRKLQDDIFVFAGNAAQTKLPPIVGYSDFVRCLRFAIKSTNETGVDSKAHVPAANPPDGREPLQPYLLHLLIIGLQSAECRYATHDFLKAKSFCARLKSSVAVTPYDIERYENSLENSCEQQRVMADAATAGRPPKEMGMARYLYCMAASHCRSVPLEGCDVPLDAVRGIIHSFVNDGVFAWHPDPDKALANLAAALDCDIAPYLPYLNPGDESWGC